MQWQSSLARRSTLLLALVFGSVALSACGQKGPLTPQAPLAKPPAGAASAPTR